MTPHKGLKCSCERSVRPVIWAPEGTEKAVTETTTGQGQDLHLGLWPGGELEGLGSEGSPWGVGPRQIPRSQRLGRHLFTHSPGGQVAGWPARRQEAKRSALGALKALT